VSAHRRQLTALRFHRPLSLVNLPFHRDKVISVDVLQEQAGGRLVRGQCSSKGELLATESVSARPTSDSGDVPTPCLVYLSREDLVALHCEGAKLDQELLKLKALRSAHVLPLTAAGHSGAQRFVAFACPPDSVNVGEKLQKLGPLSWNAVCRILAGAAHAAAECAQMGIAMGRIVPHHVQIGADGAVMVLVLGAELSLKVHGGLRAPAPEGRPAAPENLAGAAASNATDLYYLGLMGVELLAGRLPDRSQLDSARNAGRLRDLLGELTGGRAPDAPHELFELLATLTATPEERKPPSAAELEERLNALSRTHGSELMAREVFGDLLAADASRSTAPKPPVVEPPAAGESKPYSTLALLYLAFTAVLCIGFVIQLTKAIPMAVRMTHP
jgi:hypothetical protein